MHFASSVIVPLQKRAYNPTIIICSGSSTNTNDLVATVRKAGDKKAIIELEKQGQVEYTVEGDLHQRNYIVKLNATQVAQVGEPKAVSCCPAF